MRFCLLASLTLGIVAITVAAPRNGTQSESTRPPPLPRTEVPWNERGGELDPQLEKFIREVLSSVRGTVGTYKELVSLAKRESHKLRQHANAEGIDVGKIAKFLNPPPKHGNDNNQNLAESKEKFSKAILSSGGYGALFEVDHVLPKSVLSELYPHQKGTECDDCPAIILETRHHRDMGTTGSLPEIRKMRKMLKKWRQKGNDKDGWFAALQSEEKRQQITYELFELQIHAYTSAKRRADTKAGGDIPPHVKKEDGLGLDYAYHGLLEIITEYENKKLLNEKSVSKLRKKISLATNIKKPKPSHAQKDFSENNKLADFTDAQKCTPVQDKSSTSGSSQSISSKTKHGNSEVVGNQKKNSVGKQNAERLARVLKRMNLKDAAEVDNGCSKRPKLS